MAVAHKDLTGVHLHEPKGCASAASGAVYVADGAGSGVWTVLDIPTGSFYVITTTFTSNGTWTKTADCFFVRVTVIGAGGGSAYDSGAAGGGVGGTSSFGAHCTATGGGAGLTSAGGSGGAGGAGASGSENYTGEAGLKVPDLTHTWKGGIPALVLGQYGRGGSVVATTGSGKAGGTGGGGGASIKYIKASDTSATEAVGVGAAGTAGTGGTAGQGGIVVVNEYIFL